MLACAWLTTLPPDLPTVEEDAIEEAIPAELEQEQAAAVDALDARRMSVGAMSGTTAKTSFSQEEIGELDADVMVDVLPNLASASNDLAKLLLPANPKSRPVVRKEIRKAGTRYNKLYNNRREAIAIHKKAFGSTDYVQPSIVLRALLGVQHMRDVPQGPWRPDNIIYKINLAQMLRTLLVTLPDNAVISAEGYDEISNLDVHFASGIAGPFFRPSAFQICLSLLTQLAIVRMTALFTDPAFSPSKTIIDAFYMEEEDGSANFKHAAVLHMNDLDEQQMYAYGLAVQHRVDQMTDLFNEADPASWVEALGMLRVQFTWDEFLENVIQYFLERSQEVDDEITTAGGMEHIMSELSKEVERRVDARNAEEKRQSFSRPQGTPKKGFGKGGIRALKAREKSLKANQAVPAATAPVAQMTQPDFGVPEQTAPPALNDGHVRQDDTDLFIAPPEQMQSTAKSSLAALTGIQNMQRQNAAKGKGRFIDPQPGAVRVSFDDSQSQTMEYDVPGYQQRTTQSGPYYQSPQRDTAKRPYSQVENEEEDFDPTQDQGFETDMRDTAAADQRRKELPPARIPQPRFSSIGSGVPGPSASPANSPNKRARKNPGSSIPAPQRPFDPQDEHELPEGSRMDQARRMARNYSVMAASRKPTQVRTPWSNEEENALIDYIEQEGSDNVIPYATIKTLDKAKDAPLLARRSAEDMRFKARNMKETFLK